MFVELQDKYKKEILDYQILFLESIIKVFKKVDPGPASRSRRDGRALLKVYLVAGEGFEPP